MFGSLVKQPNELFTIAGEFDDVLDTDETIVLGSSSATAIDGAGTDCSATFVVPGSIAVSGTQLRCKIQGGTVALTPYKVTFLAGTSLGNVYEVDAITTIVDY